MHQRFSALGRLDKSAITTAVQEAFGVNRR